MIQRRPHRNLSAHGMTGKVYIAELHIPDKCGDGFCKEKDAVGIIALGRKPVAGKIYSDTTVVLLQIFYILAPAQRGVAQAMNE